MNGDSPAPAVPARAVGRDPGGAAREPATVLAFDYGSRRIGVAVGDTLTGAASPLAVVGTRRGAPDWQAIASLVEAWSPDLIVVGLPRHADAGEHELAAPIARFVRALERRFRLPVATVDERLSSVEAAARPGRRAGVDAVAAQVILESWLHELAHARGGERRR